MAKGSGQVEIGKERVAVALHYDQQSDRLPHVTAKGRGFIARQILELAEANDIPVRQDPDLVAILDQLDAGSTIPVAAFAAVAGILAALYRANAEMLEERAHG